MAVWRDPTQPTAPIGATVISNGVVNSVVVTEIDRENAQQERVVVDADQPSDETEDPEDDSQQLKSEVIVTQPNSNKKAGK